MSVFISITTIYAFIVVGYVFKAVFQDKVHEKTLVLLSLYCLQPVLVFWSLSIKPIDTELAKVPFIFLLLIFVIAIFAYFWGKVFLKDIKDRSILTASSSIPNAANLGVPIALALFGDESIIYSGLIIIANIILIQTLGVFSYSRGEFSAKDSLLNILKLPAFGVGIVAVLLNISGVSLHQSLLNTLQMGAYGLMSLQLILFGMFLYQVKLKEINYKLLLHVNFIKYIFTPILCFACVYLLKLPPLFAGIICLQLLMPTAVNNINLAALYNSKPIDTTTIVFVTSLIFIPVLFIFVYLLRYFGNSAII